MDPSACVPNCYAKQCGSDGCGGSCGTCTTGETCTSISPPQQCIPAASSTDGVRNGDETDVDCGGSSYPCLTGKSCSVAADCATNNCAAGVCGPQRFLATGAAVSWKVPHGATRLDVKMWGAGGGGSGGAGGYSSGSLQVSDSQTITILVGGTGSAPSGANGGAGGFGGGGNGGSGVANQNDCGGYGGGGRSEVSVHGATITTIIAGGGGGSGCGGTTGTWGAGGGWLAGTGSQTGACYGNGTGGGAGGGANLTTLGIAGIGCANGAGSSGMGSAGIGRTGGSGGNDQSGSRGRGGGGGGGGLAGGGGGGASDSWSAGVGGGGSGVSVAGGSTVAGSNTTPGNSSDPDRQGAGAPGASGVVIISPYSGPWCTPACSGKVCGPDGCGGSCGTCGSGTQCNAAQTACAAPGATATVSGMTHCTCLNGTFPMTNNGSGVWSSVALTGCPNQNLPAYVKFNENSVGFGIAGQTSTPGSGNSDYSHGTVTSTSPYRASGGASTAGNISSFCSYNDDLQMSWVVTKP